MDDDADRGCEPAYGMQTKRKLQMLEGELSRQTARLAELQARKEKAIAARPVSVVSDHPARVRPRLTEVPAEGRDEADHGDRTRPRR